MKISDVNVAGYERVINAQDDTTGLDCFIAIHDTTLGPALGGVRMYPYKNREEALEDVLRLAEGMTYKSAVSRLPLGGGKAVIMGDSHTTKTPEILRAFGEVVETLNGKYITAEDLGITPKDLLFVSEKTQYVTGLATDYSSGDPSRFTAWGVLNGLKAITKKLTGDHHLRDIHVAIQGLGSVGHRLAECLFWAGAKMTLADHEEDKAIHFAKVYGAQHVKKEEILSVKCDILAPCAVGGIISSKTIPHLNCKAIGGSANNQLQSAKDGVILNEKGILYAPDYIINSGGLINVAIELDPNGYDPNYSRDRVDHIYDALLDIFSIAENQGIPTSQAADILAEERLSEARVK